MTLSLSTVLMERIYKGYELMGKALNLGLPVRFVI